MAGALFLLIENILLFALLYWLWHALGTFGVFLWFLVLVAEALGFAALARRRERRKEASARPGAASPPPDRN